MTSKKKLLITLLSMCIVLVGCFPTGENLKISEEKQTEISKIPTSLKKDISKNLKFDASVTVPKKVDWKNCNVKTKAWDVKKVEDLFLKNKTVIKKEERNSDFDSSHKNFYYEMNDDSMLAIEDGNIRFYEKTATEYFYRRYIQGTTPFVDFNSKRDFPNDTLSNVNKEQAISLVKEITNTLGISIEESPEVYAMDLASLENLTNYNEETPKGKPIHKWEEKDQAYAIIFNVLYEGLPSTRQGYLNTSGAAVGTRLIAFVGVNGLLSFEVSNMFDVKESKPVKGNILSLSAVEEVIKKKYENVFLTDPVEVTSISLEFAPTIINFNKQEFKLSPMWICILKQTSKEPNGEPVVVTFPIWIDAVTGVEVDVEVVS